MPPANRNTWFLHMCAACSELPSYISTMIYPISFVVHLSKTGLRIRIRPTKKTWAEVFWILDLDVQTGSDLFWIGIRIWSFSNYGSATLVILGVEYSLIVFGLGGGQVKPFSMLYPIYRSNIIINNNWNFSNFSWLGQSDTGKFVLLKQWIYGAKTYD